MVLDDAAAKLQRNWRTRVLRTTRGNPIKDADLAAHMLLNVTQQKQNAICSREVVKAMANHRAQARLRARRRKQQERKMTKAIEQEACRRGREVDVSKARRQAELRAAARRAARARAQNEQAAEEMRRRQKPRFSSSFVESARAKAAERATNSARVRRRAAEEHEHEQTRQQKAQRGQERCLTEARTTALQRAKEISAAKKREQAEAAARDAEANTQRLERDEKAAREGKHRAAKRIRAMKQKEMQMAAERSKRATEGPVRGREHDAREANRRAKERIRETKRRETEQEEQRLRERQAAGYIGRPKKTKPRPPTPGGLEDINEESPSTESPKSVRWASAYAYEAGGKKRKKDEKKGKKKRNSLPPMKGSRSRNDHAHLGAVRDRRHSHEPRAKTSAVRDRRKSHEPRAKYLAKQSATPTPDLPSPVYSARQVQLMTWSRKENGFAKKTRETLKMPEPYSARRVSRRKKKVPTLPSLHSTTEPTGTREESDKEMKSKRLLSRKGTALFSKALSIRSLRKVSYF